MFCRDRGRRATRPYHVICAQTIPSKQFGDRGAWSNIELFEAAQTNDRSSTSPALNLRQLRLQTSHLTSPDAEHSPQSTTQCNPPCSPSNPALPACLPSFLALSYPASLVLCLQPFLSAISHQPSSPVQSSPVLCSRSAPSHLLLLVFLLCS
jgi:hypothetical protein